MANEIHCKGKELLRLRNRAGEKRMASAADQTALLHGAAGYIESCKMAVSVCGMATGALLGSEDPAILVIPLADLNPGNGKSSPGLLTTLADRAIFAWYEGNFG